MSKQGDKTEEPVYNKAQADHIIESVDMRERPNLLNPNCKHEWVADHSDETEDYLAYKCKFCPVGQLITKHETPD